MKLRLLVMNGQRLVQFEQEGKWATAKVEKAGTLKPGIYDLHLSARAEPSKQYDGPIIHVDKDSAYQQIRKGYVKHTLADFDKVPETGNNVCVKYDEGKAALTPSSNKLGRRIS